MIDPVTRHIWGYRALYVGLAAVIVLYRLLPLDTGGARLPPPDLLLALTLAWSLRQPQVTPIGLIVLVFLMADFLLQRPPGLMTVLVLLMTEWLKTRRLSMTEVNFAVEWASVAGAIIAIVVLERVALWILVAPQTSLGLALLHALMTIVVYPVIVLVSRFGFGMRKIGAADAEAL